MSTQNLNLAQAVQSGKPFRRMQDIDWLIFDHDDDLVTLDEKESCSFTPDDFLTSDWEIKEQMVELTAGELEVALVLARRRMSTNGTSDYIAATAMMNELRNILLSENSLVSDRTNESVALTRTDFAVLATQAAAYYREENDGDGSVQEYVKDLTQLIFGE